MRLLPAAAARISLVSILLLVPASSRAQVSTTTAHKSPQSHSKTAGTSHPAKGVDAGQTMRGEANSGPKATDAERDAATFTGYDLDVRLTPQTESLAVRALIKVRNTSDKPLAHLPLQLSSTLIWQSIRIAGREAVFGRQTVQSDADHTGQLHEAVVVLPQPLAAGKDLTLDVVYSGRIPLTAHRLEAIGTPADLARHSDWDRISENFVGLRGFGNVIWYPTSSVPVMLGDGARLFTEIGRQKRKQSAAKVSMQVTQDFFGVAPNVAVLNGHSVPVQGPPPGEAPSPNVPQVIQCSLPATTLGFATPSIFIANRYRHDGDGLRMFTRGANEVNVQSYMTAATMVQPLLREWLGSNAKTPLTILDLPEAEDSPYEVGAALFLPMADAKPEQLTGPLSHALAHAYFSSPREWLNEGVAHFMANLWIERMRGRAAAIQAMDGSRSALTIAEPGSPGGEAGESLTDTSDAIYYRTKASYVLWMLRDLAGENALSAALRGYKPADDLTPEYFERLLEQASRKNDLQWFFDDWVYHDKGLPDLSIAGVFPSKSSVIGSYLVAVEIANDGYVQTEVPVSVRSQDTKVTDRVRLPARTHTTHRIVIQGTPVEVTVNDGSVPEVASSEHSRMLDNTPAQ
ncbi:MAG TPA: hypothetical protein VM554_13970 [Acidisarcina sp.]|nr:hypothetical protein [Acidisarcina sp.]